MANEKLPETVVRFGCLPLYDRRFLPDESGIYIFVRHGEILYIGKASSLRKRCRERSWNGTTDAHLAWIRVPKSELDVVERYLIRLCRPIWNAAHNPISQRLKYR